MNDQFWMLRIFSIFTKVVAILSFFTGLLLEGALVYGWGRLTAFYDLIRTALQSLAPTPLGGMGSFQLPPLPIWPLLIAMFIVLLITTAATLTLLAAGQWVDMRLTLVKEERESRAMLVKAMTLLTRDLNSIAGYFSSLQRK
jgi:hypothetical protein